MKKLLIIILATTLFACKQETSVLSYSSPDENVMVSFTGNKSTSLDPWVVSINVKGFEYDETVSTEMYNSKMDGETVLVKWINNSEAKITLKQSDNDDKVMTLKITKDFINLQ